MTHNFDTNVILCKWKKRGEGFRLWVKGRPDVFGEADSFEAAQQALIEAVWKAADDLDAVEAPVFVYDPPLPVSAATEAFLKPELYMVHGDGRFDIGPGRKAREQMSPEVYRQWIANHLNGLHTGGFCRTCRSPIGPRTEEIIPISEPDPGFDGGYIKIFWSTICGYAYSDRFLALLTREERDRLDFRRVHLAQKSGRREYYELVSRPDLSFVGAKGFDAEGVECHVCGHRSFTFRHEPTVELMYFVCRSDLPDPLPSCFVVADRSGPALCFTRERWDQIRGQVGTKGMVAAPLGVVSEDQCERNPRLETYYKGCECRSTWPEPRKASGKTRRCWDWPPNSGDDEAYDVRNLQWIRSAQEAGAVQIVRQTITLDQMEMLIHIGKKPRQPEVISFRCTKCWRLGMIIAEPRELSLVWW